MLGQHDLNRRVTNDIQVPITELIRIAADMDRMDHEDPTREGNNWQNRMNSFMPCLTENAELPEALTLHLRDVRHMIGLPGSGKTTLLTCLAVHLAQRRMRTLLLFPKIETGLTYLDHLRFHGVSASLLSGQSGQARDRHSDRISETIAARDPEGSGFGLNVRGSEYFGKTCALAGFAVAQEEASFFPYGYAPCEKIHQANVRHKSGRHKNLLCSGWYTCGRNKASRDLIRADVWIGHIASATSAAPAHAIAERIRYLELIAASFAWRSPRHPIRRTSVGHLIKIKFPNGQSSGSEKRIPDSPQSSRTACDTIALPGVTDGKCFRMEQINENVTRFRGLPIGHYQRVNETERLGGGSHVDPASLAKIVPSEGLARTLSLSLGMSGLRLTFANWPVRSLKSVRMMVLIMVFPLDDSV